MKKLLSLIAMLVVSALFLFSCAGGDLGANGGNNGDSSDNGSGDNSNNGSGDNSDDSSDDNSDDNSGDSSDDTTHEHTMGEWYGNTATCYAAGVERRDCEAEGCEYFEEQPTALLEHTMGEWYGNTATCYAAGVERRDCEAEGCEYFEEQPTALLDHTMGEWYGNTATCEDAGMEIRDCEVAECDYFEERDTPSLGHKIVSVCKKEATCNEDGWDEHEMCSRDGCDYTTINLIYASHTFVENECMACGEIGDSEGLLYTYVDDGTCYVSGIGDCTDFKVGIPEKSPEGYAVTGIGEAAFAGCTDIILVSLPQGLEFIAYNAFESCYKLIEVINKSALELDSRDYGLNAIEVHGGRSKIVCDGDYRFYSYEDVNYLVDYIGEDYRITLPHNYNDEEYELYMYSFYGEENLTSIIVPNTVTKIGFAAFKECAGLEFVSLPFIGSGNASTETNHFGYVFGADTYLENAAYVPKLLAEVTIIGGDAVSENAFYDCSNIVSVEISESVISIGEGAFYNCTSLAEFEIPPSVLNISASAFYNCTGIEELIIPSSVTNIGLGAFANCFGIKSITVPFVGDSLEGENNKHFGYIFGAEESTENSAKVPSSLKSVAVADGSAICGSAFSGCYNIENVTLPASITSVGEYAFYDCQSLKTVVFGQNSLLASIGYEAFRKCTALSNVNLEDCEKLADVGSRSFYSCSSISMLELPTSVKSIGEYAFYDSSVTAFYINDISSWCAISFENEFSNPIWCAKEVYFDGEPLRDLVIPSGVSRISAYAFYNAPITTVSFEENSIVESIGEYAFDYCLELISVEIPASLASVEYFAFGGCSALNAVCINDVAAWCNITFASEANPLYYARYLYVGGKLVSEITIPDGVERISSSAFAGCLNVERINIGENSRLSIIESGAFSRCERLKSINIPASVTSINAYAFSSCFSLTSINVSDDNEYYKDIDGHLYTKDGKTLVQYAVNKREAVFAIPDGVETISGAAFFNCANLVVLIIPDSVTKIDFQGYDTFEFGCLTEVVNNSSLNIVAGREWAKNVLEVHTGESKAVSSGDYLFYTYDGVNYLIGYTGNEKKLVLPADYSGADYEILRGALSSCRDIVSITIPFIGASKDATGYKSHFGFMFGYDESTASIYDYAYYDQITRRYYHFNIPSSLQSVIIADGITKIPEKSFLGCMNLLSVKIPSSVTSIGDDAFNNCNKLVEIINKSSLEIKKGANTNGKVAKSALIVHDGASMLVQHGDYIFITINGVNYLLGYNGDGIVLDLPDDYCGENYQLNNYVFYGHDEIIKVTIPKSAVCISSYAFKGCDGITAIIFEETEVWRYGSKTGVANGAIISSAQLSNPSTAAKYLTSTYVSKYWLRKDP